MMLTGTPPHLMDGNLSSGMHEVRCKQRIWRREIAVECGKLLLRCEDDVLTSDYAARVEVRCPNCGSMYTLADFR